MAGKRRNKMRKEKGEMKGEEKQKKEGVKNKACGMKVLKEIRKYQSSGANY